MQVYNKPLPDVGIGSTDQRRQGVPRCRWQQHRRLLTGWQRIFRRCKWFTNTYRISSNLRKQVQCNNTYAHANDETVTGETETRWSSKEYICTAYSSETSRKYRRGTVPMVSGGQRLLKKKRRLLRLHCHRDCRRLPHARTSYAMLPLGKDC